mmetsp:Transcript_87586/g.121575  ORF Transcript_87586/g.121575 Transcript_87586/m.121575 type:complete len:208 (-) Transcript_87586:1383-2006(-)
MNGLAGKPVGKLMIGHCSMLHGSVMPLPSQQLEPSNPYRMATTVPLIAERSTSTVSAVEPLLTGTRCHTLNGLGGGTPPSRSETRSLWIHSPSASVHAALNDSTPSVTREDNSVFGGMTFPSLHVYVMLPLGQGITGIRHERTGSTQKRDALVRTMKGLSVTLSSCTTIVSVLNKVLLNDTVSFFEPDGRLQPEIVAPVIAPLPLYT